MLVNDCGSNLIFFLTLVSATSIFAPYHHKILHMTIAVVTTIDFLVKILIATQIIPKVVFITVDIAII
jgi:hypothetical protein